MSIFEYCIVLGFGLMLVMLPLQLQVAGKCVNLVCAIGILYVGGSEFRRIIKMFFGLNWGFP